MIGELTGSILSSGNDIKGTAVNAQPLTGDVAASAAVSGNVAQDTALSGSVAHEAAVEGSVQHESALSGNMAAAYGTPGIDGGYYIPSVDEAGELTWDASKAGMPEIAGANIKGADGQPGKDGVDGYTPVKGVDYFDGKDGYTPVKGVDYFDGLPGKDGKDGNPGKDGYTPIKGVDYFDGEKGDPGYTPIKGVDYFDGKDGQPGKDGQDGYTPIKGVDYFDGLPGKDGADGQPGKDGRTPVRGTDYWTDADVKSIVDTVLAQVLENEKKKYHVGYLWISTASTNPKNILGFGTWERIQDRFLLAAGSSYAAGSTGGAATHTLTVDQIPAHAHSTLYSKSGATDASWGFTYSGGGGQLSNTSNLASSGVANTGGGAAHNNMPPYLAVYVWKRTA